MRGGAGWRSDPSAPGPRPAPAGSLPARPACGRRALSYCPSPARYAPARTGGRTRLPAGRGQQTARRTGLGDAGSAAPEGSAAPAPFCLPARSSRVGLMSSPACAGLLRGREGSRFFSVPRPPASQQQRAGGCGDHQGGRGSLVGPQAEQSVTENEAAVLQYAPQTGRCAVQRLLIAPAPHLQKAS